MSNDQTIFLVNMYVYTACAADMQLWELCQKEVQCRRIGGGGCPETITLSRPPSRTRGEEKYICCSKTQKFDQKIR